MRAARNALLLIGLGAAAATVFAVAAPAGAGTVPPVGDISLLGTWVNTHTTGTGVSQVVISPDPSGTVDVDAFGTCSPDLCEWGSVPAVVYGTDVTATTGRLFRTDQAFLSGGAEWSRISLLGSTRTTGHGQLPTLTEQTFFEDGSGRHNMTRTETFVQGSGRPASTTGTAVSGHVAGNAPKLLSGALRTWANTNPAGNVSTIAVGGPVTRPSVHAYGNCAPSACDLGAVDGIVLGKTVVAGKGLAMIAPYSLGFKTMQLEVTYKHAASGDELIVGEYSEFTDGSGRSNYVIIETFVRA